MNEERHTRTYLLITATVLAGLLLRIWGMNYGFPSLFHPDEYIFVKHALGMGTGDLNPHWFFYPHLYMYILLFVYGLFYAAGKIVGFFPDMQHFLAFYAMEPWRFFQIGRGVAILFGTATIIIVYVLGRRAGKGITGSVAALVLALLPLHVETSHFTTAEPAMTFLVTLTLLFILLYQETSKTSHFYLAVATASAAVMAKYNAGMLLIPLAWIVVENLIRTKNRRKIIGMALTGFVLGAVCLFLFSPYVFLDFRSFRHDISLQYGYMVNEGWLGYENVSSGTLFQLGTLIKSFTPVGFVCFIAGAVLTLVRRKSFLLAGTIFSLVYFLYIGSWKIFHVHYVSPILPFLCVLTGFFVSEVNEWIKSRYSKIAAATVVAVLLASCLIPMTYLSAEKDIRYARKDIRLDAAEWVFKNIPQGSVIAMETWSLDLGISRPEIEKKYKAALASNPALAKYYAVKLKKYNFSSYVQHNLNYSPSPSFSQQLTSSTRYSVKWLKEEHIQFVVINSFIYGRYMSSRKDYPVQMKFYEYLNKNAELLKTFNPGNRPGPTIKIYSLRD